MLFSGCGAGEAPVVSRSSAPAICPDRVNARIVPVPPRKNDRLFIAELLVSVPAAAEAQERRRTRGYRNIAVYNPSPLGCLRDANGLIDVRVGGRKLLCFEQFPDPILFVP